MRLEHRWILLYVFLICFSCSTEKMQVGKIQVEEPIEINKVVLIIDENETVFRKGNDHACPLKLQHSNITSI